MFMQGELPPRRGRVSKGLGKARSNPLLILASILVVIIAGVLIVRFSRADTPANFSNYKINKPTDSVSPISYNSIIVKFKPSVKVTLKDGKFFSPNYNMSAFNNAVFGVYKASSVNKSFNETEASSVEKSAAKNTGNLSPDLLGFYQINFNGSFDTVAISDYLRQYYVLDSVSPSPGRAVSFASSDYTNIQFYRLDKINNLKTGYIVPSTQQPILANSDYGMNTAATENLAGASGKNVTIFNIDTGFDIDHEDIKKFKVNNSYVSYIDTTKGEKEYTLPISDGSTQHGTATVSITSADKNSFGVTGLAPDAKLLYTRGNYINSQGVPVSGVARAIVAGASRLAAGDVINISMGGVAQYNGATINIPVGYMDNEKAAIKAATQKGIYVIISAGNSASNYDNAALYGNKYPTKPYNFDDPNDPGNYLIGAVTPGPWCTGFFTAEAGLGNGPAGSRIAFSTYGSRVSPSSWGSCVASAGSVIDILSETPGKFSLDASNNRVLIDANPHDNYTMFFNGTSAAAPLVSGLVASFSSTYKQKNGFAMSPKDLYTKLVATGKPQVTSGNSLAGNVGPVPNAEKLFRDAKLFPDQQVTPPPSPPPAPPAPPAPSPPKNPPADPPPPAPAPPAPAPDQQANVAPSEASPPEPIFSDEITDQQITGDIVDNGQTGTGNENGSTQPSSGVITTTSGINSATFTSLTPKEVILSWQTENITSAKVQYGEGESLNDSLDSAASKDHKVTFPVSKFTSGKTYSYKIVSTEPTGKVVESETQTFVYPGYTLSIEVKDSSKKPVVNAQISIGDNKAFTDKDGIAQLDNVPSGNQSVAVEYNKNKQIGQVEVKDVPENIQQYSMTFTKSNKTDWVSISLIAGLVVVIAVVAFLLIRKKSNPTNIPPAYS